MKETKENTIVVGKKALKHKHSVTETEVPSKEQQIAEAFFNSTSFVKFHQRMRSIHGTDYKMLTDEHKECYRTIINSGIMDPGTLVSSYELLIQKRLNQPSRVRHFIKRLFNIENS